MIVVNEFESFDAYTNRRGVMYLQHSKGSRIIAKVCTDCKEWKFLNGFNKAKKGFAGRHSLCKICHCKRAGIYRMERKEDARFNSMVSAEIDEMRKQGWW